MADHSPTKSEPMESHSAARRDSAEETSVPATSTKVKGPRKRTKTGCLTCRKRRIKCGEEKPRCNNCIKSKRECEGYGQRVVFRDPVGPIPHLGPISASQGLAAADHAYLNRQFVQAFHHGEPSGARPFLPLAPRPSGYGPIPDGFVRHDYAQRVASHHLHHHDMPSQPLLEDDRFSWNAAQYMQSQHGLHGLSTDYQEQSAAHLHQSYPPDSAYSSHTGLQHMDTSYQSLYDSQFTPFRHADISPLSAGDPGQCMDTRHYVPPDLDTGAGENHEAQTAPTIKLDVDPGAESDEYYDVDTDDDLMESGIPSGFDMYGHAGKMLPYQLMSTVGQFHTFENYENLLSTYRPSPLASPLLDPEVLQIFHHFMTVVGPSVSIFERHPFIPSASMSSGAVPPEQQSLWTYTLPTMALEHQGLLQAMLAFSSLNMARMADQPPTASFRHYHYALRKVGKAVGLPHRRKQVPTLAATLLLGFFEVMAAEHQKWNSHLAGATHLIRDMDFARMTRDIRAMRANARAQHWSQNSQSLWTGSAAPFLGSYFENDIFAAFESDIDVGLVSAITGRAINYDEYGEIAAGGRTKPKRELTPKDVDDYRVRSDLYWWYCKQDTFHSLISGNGLLLSYDRWANCPPRAGVGRLDAAYGSMDHLVLLLARIGAFASKDRKRKLKAVEANGGEWRPPPNFFPPGMGGPPGPPGGPPRGAPPGVPQTPTGPPKMPPTAKRDASPPMYGMVPPSGPIRLPSAFGSNVYPTPPSPSGSDSSDDLDSMMAEAEAEWQEILHACEEFKNALGTPGFVPLPPDGAPLISSPFGPAIQYRTHVVACIWAFYYSARIILERSHPAMPPASMMAAGVAAPRTAQYAQLIGRIAAGVHHTQQQQLGVATANPHPTTVGVLNELMLPLFFAGVQYVDPQQRAWTVAKLRDIARITGGTSPTSVASGCEKAWVKAFEIGRGPPYKRTVVPYQAQNREGPVSKARESMRFVTVSEGAPVTFALGLLSLDENLENEN
ncbi:hypothetical protein LOZ39_004715 [Ophidiomyces ophidiicola]|nr:hypothetical protein LOZ61_003728 [Ophidiomyces ophidiicola]KAI1920019.1 hypothetical protein LOZ64_001991 [Ophidiomyces ophidiicola]KAI1927357.1 hypothetical protein LOZ60_003131 [Ophidiomyces ophidiicola]KAI1953668.1 hypothetical protein LOZ59_005018 [Ophidiomyces ophidiicola]KAI2013357.1 hypothetical protein LOZ49_002137 [Ophidiomyces ophidiicola]